MKLYPGKCRICGTRLMLQIDDAYDIEHDASKLIPMATCNPCFDLRKRLQKLEDAIKLTCHDLSLNTIDKGKAVEALAILAKKFSGYCADMLQRQHTADVGALGRGLVEQPGNWWRTLRNFETEANES